ncbi:hypothetical protein [Hasllibacter sp. MH4015]|uniref:hypothetical protein n=1 Tax=Hasllibacter sp. MH4015 TaxID=2854029 RepID=UPI001CD2D282|nr:hypothetical protein [Hasllibacter sp. MH4015]
MPNDMSHAPDLTAPGPALADRADRFAARAATLVDDPRLTTRQAAEAMGHLARLQADIAAARREESRALKTQLTRLEARFRPHERKLETARAALSDAILRAVPDGEVDYRVVPHGEVAADAGADPVTPVSACRALLDLEALRPFLSDEALRDAIQAHGSARGAQAVAGVTYARLPKDAVAECPVL